MVVLMIITLKERLLAMICVVIIAISGRDKTVVTVFCFKHNVKCNNDCQL